jgi:hypothetical protein
MAPVDPLLRYCPTCGTPIEPEPEDAPAGSPSAAGTARSAAQRPASGPSGPTASLPPETATGWPSGSPDGAPAPSTTSGKAIASLVLGIVWVWGIGAVLALILGYQARSEIRRSGGRLTGGGLAVAGIVLGWVGLAGLLFFVLGLAAFSTSAGRVP